MAGRIKSKRFLKIAAIIACLVLLISTNTPRTMAWLSDGAQPVVNSFSQSRISCQVTQSYEPLTNEIKDVRVQNTGDIPAYIRVRLIVYRQNGGGDVIGGNEQIPRFTPGEYWIKHEDGYYYLTQPIDPGGVSTQMITKIDLANYPENESQVLEVLAEAIQSFPQKAVNDAWGVEITENNVISNLN